ncbi:glycoside hydrolase family 19 protein [Pseudomonas neuropathica]
MTETTNKIQKWSYPLKVGTAEATDPQQFYKALAKAKDGYYPLGANGLWHGGVHFDEASGLVSDLTEVRCIADGEVVAYRIDEKYPTSDFGSTPSVYSTGFVLVKHRLELPAPPAPGAAPATPGPSLTFFSLYMHLLDWEGYKANPTLKDRPGFWGKGLYEVKVNAPDKPLGIRMRSGNAGHFPVLAVLPRGTTVVTQPAPANQMWVAVISVSPEIAGLPAGGWVYKGQLKDLGGGKYFVGNEAQDPIPGGAQHGANIRSAHTSGLPISHLPAGVQVRLGDEATPNNFRKLAEIVSGQATPALAPGADGKLPGFIWLQSLTPKSEPHSPMGDVVVLSPTYKIKAGEVLGHVGKYQNHSDAAPKNLLHLEVFSCEDVKAFSEQSKAKAVGFPIAEKSIVKIPVGTKLVTHVQGMGATNPPKVSDAGKDVGYDFYIPVGLLEGLSADKKIKQAVTMGQSTTTTYWWRLEGLLGDKDGNGIDGWFAEQDVVISRHSPFEWGGFNFIEETTSNADHLAAFLHAQENLNEQERETYVPNIEAAVAGSVNEMLYKILDRNGDKKLAPSEIAEALSKPWFSQPISNLVTRYENEWDFKKDKWDALDEIIGHSNSEPHKDWIEEKARIEKLSWWSKLLGQHGISNNASVQHIHPVGLISSFAHNGGCSCSDVITKEQIKLIAPAATQANIDKYTDLLTEMYATAGIVTCISKAHVLAQMLHESGSLRVTIEGYNSLPSYAPYIGRGLIQITYEENYKAYGVFVGENFLGAPDYNKMAQLPHSVVSVGWFWANYKKLTASSDLDDFIYCTAVVNGGFNGYDDRLQFLNRAIDALDIKGCAKLNKLGVYELADSKAYKNAKFSFAWGLWSDPAGGTSGKAADRNQAIIGYKRFIELYNSDSSVSGNATRKYYASSRTASVAKQHAEARIVALGGTL